MKILFITSAKGIDYLSDCIFHGLVDSGHDVLDSKYLWYLSKPMPDDVRLKLYGRGFTLSGNLPDRSHLDRSNIEEKIKSKEFDAIIYGSITRGDDFLELVKNVYPKEKVAICDGEDNTKFNAEYAKYGICFKRELIDAKYYPISFAIPEEKMIIPQAKIVKTRLLAAAIPGTPFNYTYTNEKDYYDGYTTSFFGLTCKKGGWDCLRHYEIVASGCLPYFREYEKCPQFTMTNWPRNLQREANYMFETNDLSNYNEVLSKFVNYCKANLTTKCLANAEMLLEL